MSACPSPEILAALLAGVEDPAVEDHIEHCAACRGTLSRLARLPEATEWRRRAPAQPAPPPVTLPPPERPGSIGRLGAFDIVAELGGGAMGTVYRAYDRRLSREVAIKVIRHQLAALAEFRRLFEREARAAARVKSDYVVPILQVVEKTADFPLPFLVMELVQGEGLASRLSREGALAPGEAARIARDLALGLAAIHREGLIHRDIKPGNVLLDAATGRARITDFGLARTADRMEERLALTAGMAGTPAYMSPEQFSGNDTIDGRSDIFALGVVLYEMLTGMRPFTADTPEQIAVQVRTQNPVPPGTRRPGIPRDLETICLVCLDKDPAHRFPSADALAEDLRRFLNYEPILSRRPSLKRRVALFARRHRTPVRLTAGFILLAACGTVVSIVAVTEQKQQKEGFAKKSEAFEKRVTSAETKAEQSSRFASQKAAEAQERKRREAYTRYITDVKDAWKAWGRNEPERTRALLDQHRPAKGSGEDHRGTEWYYLDGLARAAFLPLAFEGRGIAVSFSRDGKHLAAYSLVGERGTEKERYCVRLWSVPSFQSERTLILNPAGEQRAKPDAYIKHPGGHQGVAFSPDGTLLAATASYIPLSAGSMPVPTGKAVGHVKVWDTATGKEVFSASETVICGQSITFSPDGKYLLAGGYDGAAVIWDLKDKERRWQSSATSAAKTGVPVMTLHFLCGGRFLSRSLASRRVITLWPPVEDERPVDRFSRFGAQGMRRELLDDRLIAVDGAGAMAVLAGARNGPLHIVSLKDGKPPARYEEPPVGFSRNPFPSSNNAVDYVEGIAVTPEDGPPSAVAMRDGKVALAGPTGQVTLIELNLHADQKVEPVALGGRKVVQRGPEEKRVVLSGNKGTPPSLAFSYGGDYLAAISDETFTVWHHAFEPAVLRPLADFLPKPLIRPPGPDSNDLSLVSGRWLFRFLPQASDISGPTKPTTAYEITDTLGKMPTRRISLPLFPTGLMAVSSDGTRLAARGFINDDRSGREKEWRTYVLTLGAGDAPRWIKGGTNPGSTLTFDGAGKRLIIPFARLGQIVVWDIDSGEEIHRYTDKARRLNFAEFTADRRWLVAGGIAPDWHVVAIETNSKKQVADFKAADMPRSSQTPRPAFAVLGTRIAVAAPDSRIQLWDLEKGEAAGSITTAGRPITRLVFLQQGRRLLSLGTDTVTLWGVENEGEILTIPVGEIERDQLPLIANAMEQAMSQARDQHAGND